MTHGENGIRPISNNIEDSGSGARRNIAEESACAADEGDNEEEEIKAECEECEAAPIRIARDPGDPTPVEREEHAVTHLPYRSWCPVCVKAKGKEESHKRQGNKEEVLKPTVSMDYKVFGQEVAEDDKATALVIKDSATKMNFAHLCEKKGASDEWVVTRLMADLDRLGYTEVILKGDGEPSVVQLMHEVKKRRSHPTMVQHPPAYDPQANGSAEKAVQDYMGQFRALKIGLEVRLGCKVDSDWPILEWISEHAAEVLNRCQVGSDGRTPYFRLYGRHSTKGLLEIGEQVMAKPLREKKTTKKLALKDRWVHASWVGMDARTNEHVVALRDGGAAIRVRTVLRRPKSDRWNPDAIREVRATPRMPNPKDRDQQEAMPERLTRKVELGVDGTNLEMPKDETKGLRLRDFRITKKILQKHGHTPKCAGCEAAMRGGSRPHDADCRKRLEEALGNDEQYKHRIEERDTRLFSEPLTSEAKVQDVEDCESEVDVQELMQDQGNIIDAQIQGDRGHKREAAKEEEEEASKEKEEQDVKRRKLRLLISERQLCRISRSPCGNKPSRFQLNTVLNDLEWGCNETVNRQTDISDFIGALSPHEDDNDLEEWMHMYHDMEFFDDMNGMKHLDKKQVVAARKLEMEFVRKMRVYKKVPRSVAKAMMAKVLTTRWLDTNKGDEANPNFRSRMVGREIKKDNRLDLFAATPPLETLKMLLSMCAKRQKAKQPWRVAVIDIKRAYFYAPARRPVFIEIPAEDWDEGDDGMIAQLNMSLYGTRDAAQNWAYEYTQYLKSLGFEVGRASPCNFRHVNRDINLTVHGDDFVIVGAEEQLKWFGDKMKLKYELKMETLGPGEGQVQEIKILNRITRWCEGSIEYEPDQRHAELLVKELGLEECKPVATPSVSESKEQQKEAEESEPLEDADASSYRSAAARLNYLAMDRPDLQYSSKIASKHMSRPKQASWDILKRVGRYLKGCPRMVQSFGFETQSNVVDGFADSDWAGDKSTMKSTSGGVIVWGRHTMKSWASAQTTIALSSGEAELYAVLKMAVQMTGFISLAADFGLKLDGMIQTDSNAALGIVHRDGLGGRCRHIKVQYLWIQGKVKDKEFGIKKVPGEQNPADIFTKSLSKEIMDKFLKMLQFYRTMGRAGKSSRLTLCGRTAARTPSA